MLVNIVYFLNKDIDRACMTPDLSADASPASRRREKVRTAILRAAERVFAEEGEAGLSIRRLADEIDYSPAAIYKYFGSKEELIDELKETFFARLLQRVEERVADEKPFAERARECVQTYVETALERPHHYAAAFSGIVVVPDGKNIPPKNWQKFQESRKGQAFQIVVDMMKEGQRLGEIDRSFHPLIAAKSFWASCHGLAQLLINIPHFTDMQPGGANMTAAEFIGFHADMLWRSLRPSPDAQTNHDHTKNGSLR